MAFTPIPNYVDQPGLVDSLEAAGLSIESRDGVMGTSSDLTTVQAFIASYNPLPWVKTQQIAALDLVLTTTFDLTAFIRNGTVATLTGAQVGTFLAAMANNYRGKRITIQNAVSVAAVNAVDVNAGWPNNP